MELLLRAAAIRDGAISTSVSVTSSGSNFAVGKNELLHSSKISRSDPKTLLPPKKRMKFKFHAAITCPRSLTSGATMATSARSQSSIIADDSTSNSAWTMGAANKMMGPINSLSKRCSSDKATPILAVARAQRNERSSSSSEKKSNNSRGSKHQHSNEFSSEITDVDGNNMCMGYFSMPRRRSAPAVLPTTVLNPQEVVKAEEPNKHVPPSIEQEFMRHLSTGISSPLTSFLEEQHENNQAKTAKLLLCRAYLQIRCLSSIDQ